MFSTIATKIALHYNSATLPTHETSHATATTVYPNLTSQVSASRATTYLGTIRDNTNHSTSNTSNLRS